MSQKCKQPVNVEPFEPLNEDKEYRTIEVYQEGKLIKKHEGNISLVHYSDYKLIFITEDKRRHTILYNNCVILIDEQNK